MKFAKELIICRWLAVLCSADIFAFGILSVALKGNAMQGRAAGGRFFVERGGIYREVMPALYTTILWLGYSLWIAVPLLLLTVYVFGLLMDRKNGFGEHDAA